MFNKVKEFADNANRLSVLILKYGILFSCIVVGLGAAGLMTHSGNSLSDLTESMISLEIAKIGLCLFAEAFIAGVVVDIYAKKIEG